MTLRFYDSLSKEKKEFKPLDPAGKEVKMYVCGPTVYDEPHIGHLRSAYVFDVMRRWMEHTGYKVKFVRNVTDVDDKIIHKALESKPADLLAETLAVSAKYLQLYKDDLKALGILEPTVEPKATGHIEDMQKLIRRLIEAGKAYVSDGDVYFGVNDFKGYGKLSHQNKEAMLQNVRVDKNEKKRDTLDFALWKKAKDGEPSWPSPWGAGRPGWHIECSAMSMKYLGETFDIHGGGRDLIFPHHENEVAQSEACTGAPFARYWIHHGLITVNEQKMSKSLKNYVTLKDVTKKYGEDGLVLLKLLFLSTHYSMPLDYSDSKMEMMRAVLKRFRDFFYEMDEKKRQGFAARGKAKSEDLAKGMDNDFNTPEALTFLHSVVHMAHKCEWPAEKIEFGELVADFARDVFGLSFQGRSQSSSDDGIIEELVRQRDAAKASKDYKTADEIRQLLLDKHKIQLKDEKNGPTKWVRI